MGIPRTVASGNCEGSIYKRSDGRWEAKITIEGGKRKSFYGKTRREVQEQLAEALQRQQGKGLVLVEPKTGRSRRTVYLAPGTVEVLRHHQDRLKIKLAAGEPWDATALVVCTASGRPLAPSNIRRSLHRSLRHGGLPLIRVHDLRHTAATYLLGMGTHPKLVQELLGHSTVTLTLDTYSHVLPALHKQVAGQMDKLLPGRSPEGQELSSTAPLGSK